MGKSSCDNSVRCRAKNCVYHQKDSSCSADSIEIGTPHASHCTETQCSSFTCKDDCDCGCKGS